MAQIDAFLQSAAEQRASDVHVATGNPVVLRQFGQLKKMNSPELTAEKAKDLIFEILTPNQRLKLEKNLQLDFSYEIKGVARFRGNVIVQRKGFDATFRVIPVQIPSLDELGLPKIVRSLSDYHQGMILVTGATGQGKSTTLAAMIDHINSTRPVHILTIEDPIEFVHPIKKGIVNQRQLGSHTRSFVNALRSATREDPDVIMVGELRDIDSIRMAVTAAETGHLLLGTLATSSGPKTIDRLIDTFPSDEQSQIRIMLADGLRAVLTQKLLPRSDKKGLALAVEILIGTLPVANMIRLEKTFQLPSVMQISRAHGMQSMDDSIGQLLQSGLINVETAAAYAENKKAFQQAKAAQG
jgi:twitching motility protein PilT